MKPQKKSDTFLESAESLMLLPPSQLKVGFLGLAGSPESTRKFEIPRRI